MRARIIFTKEWIDNTGESERIVDNLTEVHYCFQEAGRDMTAFESDIDGTGFTLFNKHIQEFEIFTNQEGK